MAQSEGLDSLVFGLVLAGFVSVASLTLAPFAALLGLRISLSMD